MKPKRTIQLLSIIIAILLLSVGYAAIQNVTLTVSGNVTASPDQANFKVAFTKATSFSGKGTATLEVTGDTTATMNVTGLKAVGDTLTATFTVANTSTDITAYLSNSVTNTNKEYFEVTSELSSLQLAPQTGTATLSVAVKLIKSPVTGDVTDTVKVNVIASPQPLDEECQHYWSYVETTGESDQEHAKVYKCDYCGMYDRNFETHNWVGNNCKDCGWPTYEEFPS